jgi:hypothetical protein
VRSIVLEVTPAFAIVGKGRRDSDPPVVGSASGQPDVDTASPTAGLAVCAQRFRNVKQDTEANRSLGTPRRSGHQTSASSPSSERAALVIITCTANLHRLQTASV